MNRTEQIQLFEGLKVRTVWDDEQEKWFFSVADSVQVLTDSVNPTDYIKKMRRRDPELAKGWGQIVTPLSVETTGGSQRLPAMTLKEDLGAASLLPSEPLPIPLPQTNCHSTILRMTALCNYLQKSEMGNSYLSY